jgi:two-component system, chemotaxis family, protein-glutamate methylesterase/glutaminase
MRTIRVLVIEDSLTVRRRLVEVLSTDPEIVVVGEADDGKTGIEQCLRLRPDVVTLDMVLPGLSGLAVTEYIMAYCPTPILIVSASVNRGELHRTYEALAAGAVDVLDKSGGGDPGAAWEKRLVDAVKLVSRIKVITHLRLRLGALGRPRAPKVPAGASPAPVSATPAPAPRDDVANPHQASGVTDLVVIGASTGGPRALLEIFGRLPATFPLPILLVIHIGEPFGYAFAEWLNGQSPIPARFAEDGEMLPAWGHPQILLAPPDRHLVVRHGRLRLTSDPQRHSCRPSVDALFESVAAEMGPRVLACLLTGMGRDGAAGLLRVRQSGGCTIAQNEDSSVVFGMPREAILLGAAEKVLAPFEMVDILLKAAQPRAGSAGWSSQ